MLIRFRSGCGVTRVLAIAVGLIGMLGLVQAEDWPGWRGPRGDGTSLETGLPTRWSATEGIAWKVAVPGSGHSSPVVWGDRVFLTSCLDETEERLLLCFDRKDGALLWKRVVVRSALEGKNRENSYASATPYTDGESVCVTFLDGEEVLVAAFDFDGKPLWETRPGTFKSQWGFSHSPVAMGDRLFMSGYSKGENFVAAMNRADGEVLWKTAGDAELASQSYSPPLVRRMAGRDQLVVPGNHGVTSYDPADGSVIWSIGGLSNDSVISPVFHEKSGLLLSCTSWPKKILYAIRPDGSGDVTETKVVWSTSEGAPYVPSPIAVGDWFFTSSFVGTSAYCYEAATGEVLWKQSMGLHHASPVYADGLLYFLNDNGETHVVRAAAEYELVAKNDLGEKAYASPAISGGQIFIRGFEHLYCIGRP